MATCYKSGKYYRKKKSVFFTLHKTGLHITRYSIEEKDFKKTAIPSCNLPSTSKNVELDNARLQRRLKRANTSEINIDSQSEGKCSAALRSEGVPEPADFTNDEKELSSPEYILPDIPSKKRILEKTSMPSCNLPSTSKNVERVNAQLQRLSKRVNTSETNIDSQSEEKCSAALGSEGVLEPADFTNDEKELSSPVDLLMTIKEEHERKKNIPPTTDIGVQVKSDFLMCKFTDFLKNERALSTATGINSFKVLNCIVKMIIKAFGEKLDQSNFKMNLYDRVVMTYVKLKQNISYQFLALLFNCYSATHCRRVILEMINILSEILKVAIKWPTRKEISRNMPLCFEDFEDVRVVIDCTEIFIQEPKNLCCQLITHSNYKKARTVKFMTGVAPDGSITFISKAWGGRASDPRIFEQSHLIHLLEPGDAIMADKGFTIDEICAKNHWKLIRPPFLRDKKQFSKPEAMITAKIAKARVHVERSNQRAKMYKVVGETMPAQLVGHAEEIFIIICGTINLCSAILKDDKFMKQR